MTTDPLGANGNRNGNATTYDAGNQQHVQRKSKAAKARERRLDEAFRWLMGERRGRLLMWHRLSEAGVFQTSMAPSPELTAFNEGRRDLGLRDLATLMRLCPAQFARMQAEATAWAGETKQGENDDERSDSADVDE